MKMPSRFEYSVYDAVMRGEKIKDVAKAQCVSPSTIRRAMDKVTEFGCEKFKLELSGSEVAMVIGWLRNGNTSAGMLADKIEGNL
jgi:transposase